MCRSSRGRARSRAFPPVPIGRPVRAGRARRIDAGERAGVGAGARGVAAVPGWGRPPRRERRRAGPALPPGLALRLARRRGLRRRDRGRCRDRGRLANGVRDRRGYGQDDVDPVPQRRAGLGPPRRGANGAALDEGSAYVADLSGGIYRLDADDGARVWDHQLNDRVVRSSPVVSGSVVLIGLNDGRLVALDATDGDLVWESAPSEGLIGAIAVSPRVVIAVKGGSRPGLIAYEHDPEGHLVDARSPTIPQPGTLAANFAIAFVACLIVISVPFRLVRDRLGPVDAEVDGDLDEEEDRGDEEP